MRLFYFFVFLFTLSACKNDFSENSSANASLISITSLFKNQEQPVDSAYISSLKNLDLITFYQKNKYQTAWHSQNLRKEILNELSQAENEGLEPDDYNIKTLKYLEANYDNASDSTLIRYDILLTINVQDYLSHITSGKLKPTSVYKDWDLPEKENRVTDILLKGIKNDDLQSQFENAKPQHAVYKKLKNSLKILRELPIDTLEVIEVKTKIVSNKKNKVIRILKRRLMYWKDLKKQDTLTSIYDEETINAVKIFQKRHGLNPDGVIGKATIDALNFTKSMRIEQVIANLERWRWFANDFGKHYLLINIPDYKLVAIKNNDTMQIQRIVVGKDTRKTPILESKISNINLNPNWTVPPTILREDIYPEALKNRNVFRQKGLKIFDRKNNEVSPYAWKLADAGKYKYIQNPSRNNSLGSMKINFPNKFSVYLHDTNHRDYFEFTKRSLSSGCVRMEKPLEMAAYILNDTVKWPIQKIRDTTDILHYNKLKKAKEKKLQIKNAKLLAKNPDLIIEPKLFPNPLLKTIVIKVNEDILIHQLYWTAWEDNGILQFREDIYCLDHDVYAKLRY